MVRVFIGMVVDDELVMVVFWEVEEVMLVAGDTVNCGCDVDFDARSLVLVVRETYVGQDEREERLTCSWMYAYMDFSNMTLHVTQDS